MWLFTGEFLRQVVVLLHYYQPTIGEYTLKILLPYYFLSPFQDAAFIGIMLLLARGWGITHDKLGRYKIVLICTCLIRVLLTALALVIGMLVLEFLHLLLAGWFSVRFILCRA